MDFFATPAMLPFSVALGLMLGLFLLEVAMTALGATLHFDVDHPDLSGDSFLGWFHFGRIPTLLVLMLFLGCFGFSGMLVQVFLAPALGGLSLAIAVPLALVFGLLGTRFLGMGLARILPRDETNAVSTEKFVGQVATVAQGRATMTRKAEAKLIDAHGISHYFLVAPASIEEEVGEGEDVLIVSKEEDHFVVVKAVKN